MMIFDYGAKPAGTTDRAKSLAQLGRGELPTNRLSSRTVNALVRGMAGGASAVGVGTGSVARFRETAARRARADRQAQRNTTNRRQVALRARNAQQASENRNRQRATNAIARIRDRNENRRLERAVRRNQVSVTSAQIRRGNNRQATNAFDQALARGNRIVPTRSQRNNPSRLLQIRPGTTARVNNRNIPNRDQVAAARGLAGISGTGRQFNRAVRDGAVRRQQRQRAN